MSIGSVITLGLKYAPSLLLTLGYGSAAAGSSFVGGNERVWWAHARERVYLNELRAWYVQEARASVWRVTATELEDEIAMLEKRTWEARLYDIDMTRLLAPGETITGTPTMVREPSTGTTPLVLGAPVVNSAPVTYPHGVAPIGKVVQVPVSAGDAEVVYTIRARCATSLGNQVEGNGVLRVRDAVWFP